MRAADARLIFTTDPTICSAARSISSKDRLRNTTAVGVASLIIATGASAQEVLPTIDVTGGDQGGYQATQQSITRLPVPLRDTPQTVNVIPQQVIKDQRAVTMEDALRYIPGITFNAGEGGQQGDSPNIRGFAARGDIFRDGFRDPGWYTRDLFPVDRVEVYKGPSAFAFGRGSTGGAINNVSKWPTGTNFVEGTFTGTTGPGVRADLDASGKKGNISGRVAATWMDLDTPTRDNVWTKRWGMAPSITAEVDDNTKVTLAYIYQGEEGAPDYGVPYLPQPGYNAVTGTMTLADKTTPAPGYNGNGTAVTPVPINRSTWFGIATGPQRDIVTTTTHIMTAKVERDLGELFKLSNGTRYIINDRFSRVTAPRALGNASGGVFNSGTVAGTGGAGAGVGYPVDQMTLARERRERQTDNTYLVNQTDLTGKFKTGIVEHTLATGLEFARETRDQSRTDLCVATSGSTFPPACRTSLTNPEAGGLPSANVNFIPSNRTRANSFAAYLSDQMKITEYFELLGSVRFDRFSTVYDDPSQAVLANQHLQRTDNMVSFRVGGVVHPTRNSSLYVAYGDAYNPSAELGTITNASQATLAPEHTYSIEAGFKIDVFREQLSLTGAIFKIQKTNLRINADPTNNLIQVLDGEAEVDGIEIGAAGRITDKWQIITGYSYLHSEITKTSDLGQLGRELPSTPNHNFTLWSTYDLTSAFTIGGGATYQSDAYANTQNTAYVPQFWRFDAMASYKFDEKTTLQVNVYNITDKFYYAQYYAGHAVPASGRWASLSLRVRW